jgi:hypothetical protein
VVLSNAPGNKSLLMIFWASHRPKFPAERVQEFGVIFTRSVIFFRKSCTALQRKWQQRVNPYETWKREKHYRR